MTGNTSRIFFYDDAQNGLGRIAQETDGTSGFGVLAYDALGRPVSERAVVAGTQEFDFATTYNFAGDVLTRTLPTDRVITYARDGRGYATAVTTAGGAEIYASDITWHFSGQLAGWTAGNGVVTTYGYNAATLLPATFSAGGVESITAYSYQPDYRLASTTGTTTSSFSYDDLGRLSSATGPYSAGYAEATLHYGYDPIGNLTCLDASAAPSGTTCTNGKLLTYPAANPTTPPARPHAPTAISGMANPTYDTAGNMLSGNGRSYTFNPEGKASFINKGSTQLNANYLSDGNVWRISAGGVTRYRFTSDFEWNQTASLGRTQVYLGGQIIAITEESLPPPGSGGCGRVWPEQIPEPAGGELALLVAYALSGALALPMLRAMRRLRLRRARVWIALGTSGAFLVFVSVPPGFVPERAEAVSPLNTKYFHPDRLGSSLVVSDSSGPASAQRVAYRPFGELVQNAGGTASVPERGFTGQRFEASVGVYDYNARWYDPGIARFVQPDAIARAYDPQSLGPYAYVRNDPINATDPTGNDIDFDIVFTMGGAAQFGWGPGNGGGLPAFGSFGGFFSGCINFVQGSCSLPSYQQILGAFAQRGIASARAQASLIFSVVTNPIAAAGAIIDSILNPSVDYPTSISLTGEELWNHPGSQRDIIRSIGDIQQYVDYLFENDRDSRGPRAAPLKDKFRRTDRVHWVREGLEPTAPHLRNGGPWSDVLNGRIGTRITPDYLDPAEVDAFTVGVPRHFTVDEVTESWGPWLRGRAQQWGKPIFVGVRGKVVLFEPGKDAKVLTK